MQQATGRQAQEGEHQAAARLPKSLVRLAALLPVEDLSARVLATVDRSDWMDGPDDPFGRIAAALFRSRRSHVVLTGPPGVGKTAVLEELARRAVSGRLPSLVGWLWLRIDCRNVGPEDSRACLEEIFAGVLQLPQPLVLCLDGLAALLKRANGGSNRPFLCTLLTRGEIRVVGTMTPWEQADVVGGDAEMLRLFTRIDVAEPDEGRALRIAEREATRLAAARSLVLESTVVRRAVSWASLFLLNESHPSKGLRLLEEAIERRDFQRQFEGSTSPIVTVDDVAQVLAERTGMPAAMIAGSSPEADFEPLLTAAVVGCRIRSHGVL